MKSENIIAALSALAFVCIVALMFTPEDANAYESESSHKRVIKDSQRDVNYWSAYDLRPCSYDIGNDEHGCVTPNDRIVYVPNDDLEFHDHHTATDVPEPSFILLLGTSLIAFALYKRKK